MTLTIDRIEAALAARDAGEPRRRRGFRRSAVAAVMRFDRGPGRPEVLLMERAERDGDRWSGQVSMPGGREEENDPCLVDTAIRETREELGVDLTAGARLVGRSESVRAVARGGLLPMTITPYVFELRGEQPIVPSAEVASWFWMPLDLAASGEIDGRYEWKIGPVPLQMPCWRWEGRVVWGLTHRMLRRMLELVGR